MENGRSAQNFGRMELESKVLLKTVLKFRIETKIRATPLREIAPGLACTRKVVYPRML